MRLIRSSISLIPTNFFNNTQNIHLPIEPIMPITPRSTTSPRSTVSPRGSAAKKGGGWKSAIHIIVVEMAGRFAYYGLAGNLMIYLTKRLELPLAEAAKAINMWNGTLSASLLVGAFLADSVLGRFSATLYSTLIFLAGLCLVTVSTSVDPNNRSPTLFFIAIYIVAIGDGAHRAAVQTFAADQFDETTPEQKRTKSSFFNWWFLGIIIGAMSGTLVVIYIQDNVSWSVGFTMLVVSEALALAVFMIGIPTYRRQRPVGSPFTSVMQVIVAVARKWRVKHTGERRKTCHLEEEMAADGHVKRTRLKQTHRLRWLDKAAMMDVEDSISEVRDPWHLCTVTQVEEVKLIIGLIPIWICSLAYSIVVSQTHTFFIQQASTMDLSLGPKFNNFKLPPAYVNLITGITLLFFIPIYDKLLVPIAREITGNPLGLTSLQRIGVGLLFTVITMAVAAFVETKRIMVAINHGLLYKPKEVVPLSVAWLIPQFVMTGLGDLFTYVGLQEIFYDQMPEEMRSMGSALTNASYGCGALMSILIISLVQSVTAKIGSQWLDSNNLNLAHLDAFYWVLALFCMVVFVVYMVVASSFVMKDVDHGDATSKTRLV